MVEEEDQILLDLDEEGEAPDPLLNKLITEVTRKQHFTEQEEFDLQIEYAKIRRKELQDG